VSARAFVSSVASLALACLIASPAFAQAPGRIFVAPGHLLGLTGQSQGIAAGDLDSDGRPDLVSVGGDGIAVARGLGGNRFAPFTVRLPSTATYYQPALQDFDGDGNLDVAVDAVPKVGPPATSVLVAYGDGHGGFAGSTSFATPFSLILAASDINGDGRPDLVIAHQDSDSVAVFLANPNRTFTLAAAFATPGIPTSVTVGEVTGAGGVDLVLACQPDLICIYPGNGDGTFAARQDHPGSPSISNLVLGNFDTAPGLDLVCSTTGGGEEAASGTGGGSFGTFVPLPQPLQSLSLWTADPNQDGHPDVLSLNYPGNFRKTAILTWLGDGLGGFSPPIESYFWSVSTFALPPMADFNNDGNLDVACVPFFAGAMCVADGRGDGSFGGVRVAPEIPIRFGGTAAGDFDEDGHVDAVASASDQSLSFAHGDGDGTFAPFVTSAPTGLAYSQLVAGQFDADNHLDLVGIVTSPPTIAFLRGHGDGTFDAPVSFTLGAAPQLPTVADVNGDGRLDVSVPCSGANAVYVAFDGPTGLAAPVASATPAGPVAVQYRDLNSDGKLDRVLACTGQMVVQLGDGLGGFATLGAYSQASVGDVELADLDEDGTPDAILSEGANKPPTLHFRKGLGGGAFGSETLVSLDWIPSVNTSQVRSSFGKLDLLDLDGDGHLDVFARDLQKTPASAVAARGLGNGGFDVPEAYANAYVGVNAAPIADLNGDGRPDVVLSGYRVTATTPDFAYASDLSPLLNATLGVTGVAPGGPPRGGPAALAIAAVAPNPSRGHVTLAITAAAAGTARLALYAPSGREVYAREGVALAAGPNKVVLDPGAALPAGVYWLRASTRSGASAVRKVVLLGR